jgi:hypothetical protein
MYFLIPGGGFELSVIEVNQKYNKPEDVNPRVSVFSIIFGGGVGKIEELSPDKMEYHCLVVPSTWRDPVEERKNPLDSM